MSVTDVLTATITTAGPNALGLTQDRCGPLAPLRATQSDNIQPRKELRHVLRRGFQ